MTLAYGLGYGERDKIRGSVEVTRRNLFGMDRALTAFVRASFQGSRFLLSYREPWFLGHRTNVFVTAFREEEDRVSFDYIRFGGVVQAARPIEKHHLNLIGRWGTPRRASTTSRCPSRRSTASSATYTLSGPSASLVYDARDDPLEPRRGSFLGSDVALSLPVLGAARFFKGFFQAATYEPLNARTVFALAARLGLARTYGVEEPLALPLPERFFPGGDYSLRGFDEDAVGPRVPSEDGTLVPTGGNALVYASAELRFDAGRVLLARRLRGDGRHLPVHPRHRSRRPALHRRAGPALQDRPSVPCASTGATSSTGGRGVGLQVPLHDRPCVLGVRCSCSPSLAALAGLASADVVERILAVVDGRPVLQSEVRLLEAVRGLAPDEAARSRHRRAAHVRRGLARAPGHGDARGRGAGPRASPEERPELRERVVEADLTRLVRRQPAILKYVEFRFRPQVRVTTGGAGAGLRRRARREGGRAAPHRRGRRARGEARAPSSSTSASRRGCASCGRGRRSATTGSGRALRSRGCATRSRKARPPRRRPTRVAASLRQVTGISAMRSPRRARCRASPRRRRSRRGARA